MSDKEMAEKVISYERALAQLRLLIMMNLPAEHLTTAILAVLQTAGITLRMAQHYRNEE